MITEFLIKWWELIVIGFLLADIIVQKTKWKGDDDILAMIKNAVKYIFTAKPGVMPMLLGFLLVPVLLFASDVTFEWDSNTESDMAYYNIYKSSDQTTWSKVNVSPINHIGTGTETWTETGVIDGTWYWYVTAVDTDEQESLPSNILTATIETQAPAPPQNFLVSLIQKIFAWIKGLFSGSFRIA